MYWANFLHIYQPPIQKKSILERVVNESYRKITQGLLANPSAKLTLNINAGLTEMLVNNGYQDVVRNLRTLLERNQIEITSTAKYHPLLPKLPKEEIIRQIKLNEQTNRSFFGKVYKPLGFFPPEMGYSQKLGKIVKNLGYKWIILDETAVPFPIDYTKTYQNTSGLGFFFRERKTSFMILSAQLGTARVLMGKLKPRLDKNEYLLTAMDGETFGHHRPGLEQLLWEISKEPKLPTITISELLFQFPEKLTVKPQSSSWAFLSPKLTRSNPFIRWKDPKNEIHQRQWQLVKLAIEVVKKEEKSKSRQLLDQSLYSDQFWWASAKPWWSLEIVEEGAHNILETIKSCPKATPLIIAKARNLYLEIISTCFEWQRSGKVEKLARKEDEEIKQRLKANRPSLSKKDYNQIIKLLTGQMLVAAKVQEYIRAEQIKTRINELKAEEIKVNL